jgi:AraC-like DNA-binding protein
MISFDPNRPDFAPYGLTCVRWTPSPMPRPDHHNEVELNLLGSGYITYLLGGQKVRIGAGQLSVFWAAIPHQIIDIGTGAEYFVATIPFAWFLQFRLPEHFTQPLLLGAVHCAPPAALERPDLDLFAQWEADLRDPKAETTEIVMLEMRARLMRLAALAPKASPARKPGRRHLIVHDGGLNKVEQMACLIARRYTEPLTVDEIGQAVDLHPNYAMSLFKQAFGTTLVDYLTHHRISHAQRLLATGDEKIVDVALASGFNSISRFNEAFRKSCGCSPREYRQRHALAG